MLAQVLPVGWCLLLWWLGTGAVLRLNRSPDSSRASNVWMFSVAALLALWVLVAVRSHTSIWAAGVGFGATIVIWGWLEYLHYSGCLVGPREQVCPVGISAWQRFGYAFHAMLYRELSLLVVGGVFIAIHWQASNPVALYTYLVLWLMRISAEINVFLGIANLPEQWLPARLHYLMSYRTTRRFNAFFPLSVLLAGSVCWAIYSSAPAYVAEPFQHTVHMLVATLLLLAVVEHLVLVLPVKGEVLWSWVDSRPV